MNQAITFNHYCLNPSFADYGEPHPVYRPFIANIPAKQSVFWCRLPPCTRIPRKINTRLYDFPDPFMIRMTGYGTIIVTRDINQSQRLIRVTEDGLIDNVHIVISIDGEIQIGTRGAPDDEEVDTKLTVMLSLFGLAQRRIPWSQRKVTLQIWGAVE